MGLHLRDYTLREMMRLVDVYLKGGTLNTIACVSAQLLMRAEGDARQKEWLEAMDLVVYCDTDIARAAGITARSRLKEIENNSFLKEFFKKLIREKRAVYLLSDTADGLRLLETDMESLQGLMRIAGKAILQEDEEKSSTDIVINDINDKAPDVILTLFADPAQEAFAFHNKDRINADIWLGLQKDNPILGEGKKGLRTLIKRLQIKIFQRKVHQYENQEKAES